MVLAGDIALLVAFLECVLFVVGYALTAPFYRSEEGTHLLTFTTFLAVVLGYLVYANVQRAADPQSPLIRLVILSGLVVFMGWRLSILVRRQILDTLRKRRDAER